MPDNDTTHGRRKDDIMLPPNELPPEVLSDLSESQKIHLKLLQNITSLNTAVNDLYHTVQTDHAILVTGNGKPSLQEQVRSIEKYIYNIQYWGRFVGGALVVQTLGFFLGIIIALVRFLPVLERLATQQP